MIFNLTSIYFSTFKIVALRESWYLMKSIKKFLFLDWWNSILSWITVLRVWTIDLKMRGRHNYKTRKNCKFYKFELCSSHATLPCLDPFKGIISNEDLTYHNLLQLISKSYCIILVTPKKNPQSLPENQISW